MQEQLKQFIPYSSKYFQFLQNNFVHLHNHSEYSNLRLLDSINKIENMVRYTNKMGNPAMALTDHESLSGHVKYITTVENLKSKNKINKNFKAILGNEIYLVDEEQMNRQIEELGYTTFYHFLLLAKDDIGHEQLRELSTRAWYRMFSYKGMERVPTFYSDVEEVTKHSQGHLIASTACLGGKLSHLIIQLLREENEKKQDLIKDNIHEFIMWCITTFGEDNFYIELQPSLQEEQIAFNKMAINIAKAYQLPWIITTDAHYLKPEDREIHKAYLTSDEEGTNNREVDDFYSTTRFFTVEELFQNMNYLDKKDIELAILNTKKIADKVIGYNLHHKQIIPKAKVFDKKTWIKDNDYIKLFKIAQTYSHINTMINSKVIYDNYLIYLALQGIIHKIKDTTEYKSVFERINIECKELIGASKAKKEPLSAYFITMNKNIDIIWEEANSIVAPGRGSAGGFILDYLLGITQINPLKQGIEMPHWRFISAERPDMPDIDIDIPSYKKNVVLEKVKKYYESLGGNVVRVCTFGTETSKSAIQTACRGLKINSDVALYLSSLIPVERGKVWSISDCFYGNESKDRKSVIEFKNLVLEYSDKKLLQVALGIEGLINKRSSHACFDANTLITTEEGLKRIKDIEIGDKVLTHKNRFKPVIKLFKTETDIVYRINTYNNNYVETTPNHPFLIKQKNTSPTWKHIQDIDIDNDYLCIPIIQKIKTNKQYIWTKVFKLEINYINKPMYNLSVLDDNSYVANGLAVHNCGILITNEKFTKYNAMMRTPSKELVSQLDLGDSEYVGNLKYDFLCTKTCAMIQITLEMLLKNHKIEWQGSLRKTYDKYLHPDILDTTSTELWDILNKGDLISAFQFDSPVGERALKLIQPMNLLQATDANNLMRLMGEDGQEQPLEKYVRYKSNINQWIQDMKQLNLTDKEIEICKNHLLKNYGVCSTQEGMMMLAMDKQVANFNVVEANILRKGVAKKIGDKFEQAHKLLYEKGKNNGTSYNLLSYIWDVQIAMQRGYGFSLIHGIEYTYILIQQLNLVLYFPSIYWNTAVLLVESGALEMEKTENEEFDKKEKTTNYGSMATAIGTLQSKNVKIVLPNINNADQGFKPDEENNQIVFGLKGITNVNNETAQIIIKNRPYKSLLDFHKRLVLVKHEVICSTGKKQMKSLVASSAVIMLIKAGAFDLIEQDKTREEILENYLKILNPPRKKLDARVIPKIADMGLIDNNFDEAIRYYYFRDFIMQLPKYRDDNTKSIIWYKLNCEDEETTEYTNNFFLEHFAIDMQEGKDYFYDEEGIIHVALGTKRKGSFESLYSSKIQPLMNWILTDECKQIYNNNVFEDIKRNKMKGNISSWEMESMNFYYHDHELKNVNKELYDIVNFNELPEKPEVIGFTRYKKLQYPKFALHRIVGTVLDRDKNRHTISLLTPNGVVRVKFYSGQFSFYDKTISKDDGIDKNGKIKKITLENGWFTRGQKLMITGFRRGDMFKPKRYSNSIYQHTVQKILEVKEDNTLVLQSDRVKEM